MNSTKPTDDIHPLSPANPSLEECNRAWLEQSAAEISMEGAVALIVIGVDARTTTIIIRGQAEKGLVQRALLEALNAMEKPRAKGVTH